MKAERITTVTSSEYWLLLTRWCVYPYHAGMGPPAGRVRERRLPARAILAGSSWRETAGRRVLMPSCPLTGRLVARHRSPAGRRSRPKSSCQSTSMQPHEEGCGRGRAVSVMTDRHPEGTRRAPRRCGGHYLRAASSAADQSVRWARATMIPSGPRTYAMRQTPSYWPTPPTRW